MFIKQTEDMALYSIRELALISGIKAHNIRIWEKRYKLFNPKRTATNIRYYSDADLKKLLNVSMLSRNGLKISKIAHLDENGINVMVLQYAQEHYTTDDVVESLVLCMIDYNEEKFETILSDIVSRKGMVEAYKTYLNPFLERVGLLWQADIIISTHEHFVTHMIRKKIMTAIDAINEPVDKNKMHFLLFLPEGEFHETGLLFFYYILRKAGYPVTYLGQSVPSSDLSKLATAVKPGHIVISVTTPVSKNKWTEIINTIDESFVQTPVVIFGLQIPLMGKLIPNHYYPILTLDDLFHFIETLSSSSIKDS
jgi:MerR family transcriptional regulator, light-induced transcriptional regulator